MTVFDSRVTRRVRRPGDNRRTPQNNNGDSRPVGWVAALVWPAVWTAVIAGALLGAEGRLIFWAGVVGVLAMFARQAVKVAARNVRGANLIIDSAPYPERDV